MFEAEDLFEAEKRTVQALVKFFSEASSCNFKDRVISLHCELSKIWGVCVKLEIEEGNIERGQETGGAEFDFSSLTIFLYVSSIWKYLHEFRHVLQLYRLCICGVDPEEDADCWSFVMIKEALSTLY